MESNGNIKYQSFSLKKEDLQKMKKQIIYLNQVIFNEELKDIQYELIFMDQQSQCFVIISHKNLVVISRIMKQRYQQFPTLDPAISFQVMFNDLENAEEIIKVMKKFFQDGEKYDEFKASIYQIGQKVKEEQTISPLADLEKDLSFTVKSLYEEINYLDELIQIQKQMLSTFKKGVCCAPVTSKNVCFKCRTCETRSDNQIICQDCFIHGNHKDHVYVFCNNLGGGYCDCGDMNALIEGSTCSKHNVEQDDELIQSLIQSDLYDLFRDFVQSKFEILFMWMEKDLDQQDKQFSVWKELKNKQLVQALETLCDFLKDFCDYQVGFSVLVAKIFMEEVVWDLKSLKGYGVQEKWNLAKVLLVFQKYYVNGDLEEKIGQFLISLASFRPFKEFIVQIYGNYYENFFVTEEGRKIRSCQMSIMYLLIFNKEMGEILYLRTKFLKSLMNLIDLCCEEVLLHLNSSAYCILDKHFESLPYNLRNTQDSFMRSVYDQKIIQEYCNICIKYGLKYQKNWINFNFRYQLVIDNCLNYFLFEFLKYFYRCEVKPQQVEEFYQQIEKNQDSLNFNRVVGILRFICWVKEFKQDFLQYDYSFALENSVRLLSLFRNLENKQNQKVLEYQGEEIEEQYAKFHEKGSQKEINDLFFAGKYLNYDLEIYQLQQGVFFKKYGFKEFRQSFEKVFKIEKDTSYEIQQQMQLSFFQILNQIIGDRTCRINIFSYFYYVDKMRWVDEIQLENSKIKELREDILYVLKTFFIERSKIKFTELKEQIFQIFEIQKNYEILIPYLCDVQEDGYLVLKNQQKDINLNEFSLSSIQKCSLLDCEFKQQVKDWRSVIGNEKKSEKGTFFAQIKENLVPDDEEIFLFIQEIVLKIKQNNQNLDTTAQNFELIEEILKFLHTIVKQETEGVKIFWQKVKEILKEIKQLVVNENKFLQALQIIEKNLEKFKQNKEGEKQESNKMEEEVQGQQNVKKQKMLEKQKQLMEKMKIQQQQVQEKLNAQIQQFDSENKFPQQQQFQQFQQKQISHQCNLCREESDSKGLMVYCCFFEEKNIQIKSMDLPYLLNSCYHCFHFGCLTQTINEGKIPKIPQNGYLCPFCQTYCNTILPILHELLPQKMILSRNQILPLFQNKEISDDLIKIKEIIKNLDSLKLNDQIQNLIKDVEEQETFFQEENLQTQEQQNEFDISAEQKLEKIKREFQQILEQKYLISYIKSKGIDNSNILEQINFDQEELHSILNNKLYEIIQKGFLRLNENKLIFFQNLLILGNTYQFQKNGISQFLKQEENLLIEWQKQNKLQNSQEFFFFLRLFWQFLILIDFSQLNMLLPILSHFQQITLEKIVENMHNFNKQDSGQFQDFELQIKASLLPFLKMFAFLQVALDFENPIDSKHKIFQIETNNYKSNEEEISEIESLLKEPIKWQSIFLKVGQQQKSVDILGEILDSKFKIYEYKNFEEMIRVRIPQKCIYCNWYVNQQQGIMLICLLCNQLMCKGICKREKEMDLKGNVFLHTKNHHKDQSVYMNILTGQVYVYNSKLGSYTYYAQIYYDSVGNPHQFKLFDNHFEDWTQIQMDKNRISKLNEIINDFSLNQITGSFLYDTKITQRDQLI